MPPTIKDIARRAGVSHSTVSRALRGSPLISEETTRRIRKTATEMGYYPSAVARSLKTNSTQVLGVVVSSIDDPFFGEILQGIEETAQSNGYSLFIAASQSDPSREKRIVKALVEHRVDGVIICSTSFSTGQRRELLANGRPIVVVNNQSTEKHRNSIYHDDMDGSRQVTHHLIELGHRRIAYLGNSQSGRTNLDRLAGFREEMNAAGLAVVDSFIYQVPGGGPENADTALRHFLSLPERPTAIFCYNDMLAIGLLRGLQQAGLHVPKDFSLAGFDNITFSGYTNPPLTTFDQPKRFIGAEAARLILTLLQASKNGSRTNQTNIRVLKGRLLVRASTAAPPL